MVWLLSQGLGASWEQGGALGSCCLSCQAGARGRSWGCLLKRNFPLLFPEEAVRFPIPHTAEPGRGFILWAPTASPASLCEAEVARPRQVIGEVRGPWQETTGDGGSSFVKGASAQFPPIGATWAGEVSDDRSLDCSREARFRQRFPDFKNYG